MSSPESKKDRLVERLEALAASQPPDRGALANLRASLKEDSALDGLRIVLPYVTVRAEARPFERQREEDDALLLGGLFALHGESGNESLASALRRVWAETGSDSVEARFSALMSASREDLASHLRHAVSLVASKKIPIDWRDLHRAIRHWQHEDDFVRRQWARDFWASADEPVTPDTPVTG